MRNATKFSRTWFSLTLFVGVLYSCKNEVPPPEAILPVPTERQLAWHEMELNVFVHYTTNTFTDKEWGYGDESPKVFNPTEQDVDQWMKVFKETGFKGVILTTKHHDGFCLWPSDYTEHSVKNSPYKDGKGDIVKEVSDAAKRQKLKFGVYLSPWDRNHPEYGNPKYLQYYRNQLMELFTAYGPIFEMWFDGANGGDGYYGGANETRKIDGETYYEWPKTLKLVRSMEKDVIFFSDAGPDIRWCGNEKGIAGETNWAMISPDTLYAGKAGIENLLNTGSEGGNSWIPAEVDVSIRPGWFYHEREDSLVKSPEKLLEIYLSSVGRGSPLLLNVPPDRRGKIHENDVAALTGWRKLLDKEFNNNLVKDAKATADSYRGDSKSFNGSKAIDGDKETYWALDDGILSGTLEIDLGEKQGVKYILLQEHIKLGQRVKEFSIEALKDDVWHEVANGTTIGYKRILNIDPTETEKIRIKIKNSRACPIISNVEVY